jgi:predicted RND superfamily exporter protein
MKELFDLENRTPLFLAANVVAGAGAWIGKVQPFLGMIAVTIQILVGIFTLIHLIRQYKKKSSDDSDSGTL